MMSNDNIEIVCQDAVTQKLWEDSVLQELGKL